MSATDPPGVFIVQHKARWGDCDPAGVVYTPRFADYVVEAHLAQFRHIFGLPTYKFMAPFQRALPAKALELEFNQSIYPEQAFSMAVEVYSVRTCTYTLKITGSSLNRDRLFVAALTLICIDTQSRKREPLPRMVCDRLEAELLDAN